MIKIQVIRKTAQKNIYLIFFSNFVQYIMNSLKYVISILEFKALLLYCRAFNLPNKKRR